MKSRLDKILSQNGYGSRRDIKKFLRTRELTVNGVSVKDPACLCDGEKDSFTLDGEPLRLRERVYLMLNKIAGVVTSTDDPVHRTVLDLLSPPWDSMDLFPVGRLDVDTEGLLILTNDGPLTHRLTSPKTGVDKTYYVRLRDSVNPDTFASYEGAFARGVTFHDGYTCLPANLYRADGECAVLITIQEGKYHQVKKMFKVVGNEVVYLKRISMGKLGLDQSLAPGEYRELTESEVALLKKGEGDEGRHL